ncbi:MAG TPA: lipoyl(octanoyl) transferase LipB [Chromatiales bacterium]|nr:lipoyl(octanoyl) transferase LipB [Thiotrichales bacterium]HIP68570.1 lipoyl(octanoyl) transferase LipB [Chromatiales bacterium]
MSIEIIDLGTQDYQSVWQHMRDFTDTRTNKTNDQLWIVEHPSVFTLGQAGKPEHVLNPGDIPVIQTDRGGQVTYHGPGQLVIYLMVDLRRRKLGVRQLVNLIEQAIIKTLSDYNIESKTRPNAPGVYVDDAKIAALGLRVRKGCSYHGLSLNVDMDLEPFSRINPCGFPNLSVTQISELSTKKTFSEVSDHLTQRLIILMD